MEYCQKLLFYYTNKLSRVVVLENIYSANKIILSGFQFNSATKWMNVAANWSGDVYDELNSYK